MAQVSLQVVVNRQQVDQLVADVNKLNGMKINLQTSRTTKDITATETATRQLLKTEKERQRVLQETEKTEQQKQRTEQQRQRTITETNKAERSRIQTERELANQQRETEKAQRDSTNAQREHNEEVKKGGLLYDILGRSLLSFIARMAAYRAVYGGIRVIVNGFKEALQTMKEVDAELVTVRKVTGFSAEQMAAIEKNAYAVASKYGSSAVDYTESVASFARAGYRDLSPALAELSTKTQIVGDTTADIANQFLLSVDAAYKYQGSIEKLTAVLDGANEIDNKYATSIEKIAEGMGIVAPVAEQMHVGVDELAASLGVITAVTQRSGSEAARALRAIFLNIVGDTKTEIEEGVTWTTGEIAGLRDIIKVYAKDAYDAAQATGRIIDPMEAIAGLSKSLKDGLLTEAELMEMVSDIGGKLRTSQLLALINNWDMYESMLQDYRNAYGSADKEVENAMNSWDRKMNVLKNTWTAFIRTLINPDLIKKGLDLITSFIEHLDSLPAVLMRITMIVVGMKLPKIVEWVGGIGRNVLTLFTNLAAGTAVLQSVSGLIGLVSAAVGVLWTVLSQIVQERKLEAEKEAEEARAEEEEAEKARQKALQDSKDSIATSKERIKTLQDLREEYLNIISSTATEAEKDAALISWKNRLADAYGVEREALESVNAERRTGLALLDALDKKEIERAYGSGLLAYDQATSNLGGALMFSGTTTWGALKVLQGILNHDANGNWTWETSFSGDWLRNETGYYGFGPRQKLYEDNGNLMGWAGGHGDTTYTGIIEDITAAMAELNRRYAENAGLTEDEQTAMGVLTTVLEEVQAAYSEDKQTVEDFIPIMARYNVLVNEGVSSETIRSTEDFATEIERLKEAYAGDESLDEMINVMIQLFPQYAKAAGYAITSTQNLSDALSLNIEILGANEKALDANATASERAAAAKKDAEAAVRKLIPALFDETGHLTAAAKAALEADSNLAALAKAELEAELAAKQANYTNAIAQLASLGGMAAYAKAQMELLALSDLFVSNPIAYAAKAAVVLGNMAAQIAKIGLLQTEIQSLANQIAAISYYAPTTTSGGGGGGGGGDTTTEDTTLTAIKNRITLLKSEYNLMKERGDSDEDLIAKMREIEKALQDEAAYLQSIGGDQATINDLLREAWSYHNQIEKMLESEAEDAEKQAEAIQKALDAQIALNNALSNRNVRVYNAATGQWEWTANPSSVQSALEAYQSAVSGFTSDDYAQLAAQLAAMGAGGSTDIIKNLLSAPGGSSVSNLGNNHYGNNYNFAGMTFTEAQAKSMTLYDLAQLSGNLTIYR